jgi:hypothetical protein
MKELTKSRGTEWVSKVFGGNGKGGRGHGEGVGREVVK